VQIYNTVEINYQILELFYGLFFFQAPTDGCRSLAIYLSVVKNNQFADLLDHIKNNSKNAVKHFGENLTNFLAANAQLEKFEHTAKILTRDLTENLHYCIASGIKLFYSSAYFNFVSKSEKRQRRVQIFIRFPRLPNQRNQHRKQILAKFRLWGLRFRVSAVFWILH